MLIKVALMVVAITVASAAAAEPSSDEYRVKGAYLLNFTKFVEWPEQTFNSPAQPISVCVFGSNPFGPALEVAAHNTAVGGRVLVVQKISEPQQARQCQVVFIGGSDRKRIHSALEAVRSGVLTVGESDGFLAAGGMVNFFLDASKVRFEINQPATEHAGLHISAKLLSLAQSSKK